MSRKWLYGALALTASACWVGAAQANADSGADFLLGSTHAIIMGPTGIPDPTFFPGYIPGAVNEYLLPLGFSDAGTITPLTTPETIDFGPSVSSGVGILVQEIEKEYDAHLFSASDPLTVFGYSQSAIIGSVAQQQLAADHIPLSDIRFVLIGDPAANPPSGPTGLLDTWGATPFGEQLNALFGWSNLNDVTTPDDLYKTAVFTVDNDYFADTATPADFAANPLGALWQDFLGFFEHGVYLGGLPDAEILSAIDGGGVADNMTTYFSLADPANLFQSLFDVTLGSFGISV